MHAKDAKYREERKEGKRFLRVIISLLVLLAVAAGCLYVVKKIDNYRGQKQLTQTDNSGIADSGGDKLQGAKVKDEYRFSSSRGIDSILFTFGIKREWITTSFTDEKKPKEKSDKNKQGTGNVLWYLKKTEIPNDLNPTEVNLELTDYLRSIGLYPLVTENIKSKEITFTVYGDTNPPMSIGGLAKIFINHSDKVKRENGVCALILKNAGEFNEKELDEILNSKSEFSFVFPRSFESIDIQSKLIHSKRDVIMNLVIGTKDNYNADFRANAGENEIRKQVRNFYSDFSSVTTVLLTKAERFQNEEEFMRKIINEFKKYNISAYPDTMTTDLSNEGKSNKISKIRDRIASSKKLVCIVGVSYNEFKQLQDEVMKLKKLGYKFVTFNEYMAMKKKDSKIQSKDSKIQ